MNLMENKRGLIFGASNTRGIAYGICKELNKEGAKLAFTYANDALKPRVQAIADEFGSDFMLECDVTDEEQVQHVFNEYAKKYGKLDFVLHAVAFANRDDLTGEFINTSKAGFDLALSVSTYSLISLARAARPLMTEGGSILALTYLASQRVVANYNVMGVAKAALEASTRYLAADLGKDNIRVNTLSSGAVKTLAAKGISGFDVMLKASALKSPLKRNVTLEDVGKSAMYLLSDLSSGVTGETLYVDCGCNSVYASIDEMAAIMEYCRNKKEQEA